MLYGEGRADLSAIKSVYQNAKFKRELALNTPQMARNIQALPSILSQRTKRHITRPPQWEQGNNFII